MKCIYCNAENELTLSDIITYAITWASSLDQTIHGSVCFCSFGSISKEPVLSPHRVHSRNGDTLFKTRFMEDCEKSG